MEKEKRKDWETWCKSCWKGFGENDIIDTLGWAAVFIWAGLVLLTETKDFAATYSWWDGWAVFFTGAGTIVLLQTAVRLLAPRYRKSITGSLVFGLVLLGIGLGDLINVFWPFVLIAIGVIILIRALVRSQRER